MTALSESGCRANMNIRQLFQHAEIKLLKGTVAAGTDVSVVTDPAEIDMLGYDSVAIIASLGAIATGGTFTMNVKNSATSGSYGSGSIDNIGSAQVNSADTDDNKFIIKEVFKPQRRYLRVQYQRETGNVTINNIVAILFNAKDTQTPLTEVEAIAYLNSPTPSAT